MLGPVFSADLRSHSRRPRMMLARITFLCILLILFLLCYSSLPGTISRKTSTVLADFAANFAILYMIGQFAFLMLIGPTYVAGAIAEERQRGTLDYLFSSNLTNYEIIAGKYFSRLALLTQYVLVGLPVLALTQFIGGVSLELILGMQLGTLGCLASFTALSVLLSVISRNARDALVRTFLFLVGLLICWFLLLHAARTKLLSTWLPPSQEKVVTQVLMQTLEMNPVFVALELREHLAMSGNIEGLAVRWYGRAFGWHLLIAMILLGAAIGIVRKRFLKQIDKNVSRARHVAAYRKPEVWSALPLYWKERYVQGSSWRLFGWVRWFRQTVVPNDALMTSVLAIAFTIVILTIVGYVSFPLLSSRYPGMLSAVLWLIMGLLVCSMIAATVRTASGIAVEKDRETWDALLASPVAIGDLLLCRLYGGWLSARWLFIPAVILLLIIGLRMPWQASSYARNGGDLGTIVIFVFANVGYLVFHLGLAGFCSLNTPSSIRNVMSAMTLLLTMNLLPLVVRYFFMGMNSSDSLVGIIYFVTSPGSVPAILGLGGLAVVCVVLYYRMPQLRWLYGIVKWMGNILLLNAMILLVLSCFTFAFGGYLPFERVVLFISPVLLDYMIMSEQIMATFSGYSRYPMYYGDGGVLLFLCGSSAVFAMVGVLLYWWSLYRLKKSCGRIEYSKAARRMSKLVSN